MSALGGPEKATFAARLAPREWALPAWQISEI
jgi:hypothetical protein